MSKRIFLIFCLLFIVAVSFSQNRYYENPFLNLRFSKGFTDTTIIASFSGISNDVGISNKSLMETISKHTGKKIKGFNYAIDLKIGDYSLLSVACKDQSMLDVLKNNVGKNTQLRIKCTVYRFYTFDGICNFFYINKLSLI
ncbi:hypothetical protein GCM10027049_17090 [Mucilaginibacter puniceus]